MQPRRLHLFIAYKHIPVEAACVLTTLTYAQLHRPFIPVAFETAWVLAALAQANHIVSLCSGPSLVCRLHAFSSALGIYSEPSFTWRRHATSITLGIIYK